MAPRMSPPEFPPRKSSLSPSKRPASNLSRSPRRLSNVAKARGPPTFSQTIGADARLQQEIESMEEKVARHESTLRLQSSFDAQYWTRASRRVRSKLALNELKQKRSIRDLQVDLGEFGETREGLDLFNENRALEVERMLVDEQIQRQERFHAESASLKSFVEVFISSPIGFNIRQVCRGKRDGTRQQNFAIDLISKQNSCHPDPEVGQYWCPILLEWLHKAAMTAGHLVAWRCGSHGMRAIFGDDLNDAQGNTELFKAENGIYWSRLAEERFSAGLFVMVPDVPEDPTVSQIKKWEQDSPKEYKIMVLDPEHKLMRMKLSAYTTKTWADKHGQKVQFRGDFRPRARYLYFTYCEALLKRSFVHQTLHYDIAKKECRKKYWGTPGRYVLKNALRGFLEVMGHQYSHILNGGIEDEDENPAVNMAGLALAARRIQDDVERRDPYKDEDESDSDAEDRDEDGA
ncbi:MAG: hypothetical protein Q9197_003394 [Variospora fuerteventurae]